MEKKFPPRPASWLVERMLDLQVRYAAMGDFEERFQRKAGEKGWFRACFFYCFQVMLLIPAFLKNFFYWSFEMFKHYLKIALRNMRKHKGYAFVNIAGLAVGLALFTLVALYIQFELSFDRFHENRERIYRVEQVLAHESVTEKTAGCPTPLSQVLKEDIPEIEAVTRVIRGGGRLISTSADRKFEEDKIFVVDNSFLEMFSFPLVKGDVHTALSEPFSLVVCETTARKLFRDEEPIGQVVRIDGELDFKVTGVMEDVPPNSHLRFNMLFSVSTYPAAYGKAVFTRWWDNWVPVYVMLPPDHSFEKVNGKIQYILKKYQGERSRNELYLRPLTQIHLYADVKHEIAIVGSKKNVYIFAAVSVFVLMIACINFMNLATARSADRAREVGLRKVVGAPKVSIVKQFLGEAVITVFISMIMALVLARAFLFQFSQVVNRQLSLNLVNNWVFTLALLGLTLVVGCLAGFYPALFLSSFRPVNVLKGWAARGGRNILLRKGLVVFQFFVSIALIIGTAVILQQNHFLLKKDLGYSSDQILVVHAGGPAQRIETFKNELLKDPKIMSVGVSDYMVHSSTNWCYLAWEGAGPEDYMKMNVNYVDEDLVPTYGMTIEKGRAFTKDMRSWDENVVILNEAAVRSIGWEEPIGKRLLYNVDYRSREVGGATVVGVVKDYHFLSLHNPITPIMMRLLSEEQSGANFSVKVSTENVSGTISFIKSEFERMFPEQVFSYRFLDEDFEQMYLEEKKAGRVILALALIAVLIACLGLFGLSSYTTKQRTKEIGIRKVVGASVPNITAHLTSEFLKLVFLANFLAWPIAYYIMHKWLMNFPYRINMSWLVFVMAGFAAVIIALLTVSCQAVRAARTNPVDSLRYE